MVAKAVIHEQLKKVGIVKVEGSNKTKSYYSNADAEEISNQDNLNSIEVIRDTYELMQQRIFGNDLLSWCVGRCGAKCSCEASPLCGKNNS